MSDNNKKKKPKKNKKCEIKCSTCEFFDAPLDYCSQKKIKDCSKQVGTDFSQCSEYLTKESLIYF